MGKEKLTSKRRAMAGDNSMEARVSKKLGLIPKGLLPMTTKPGHLGLLFKSSYSQN
jgi:hypothetical protein